MIGIFLAALVIYFTLSYRAVELSNRVYSVMGEAELPVLFAESGGIRINPMHGYTQDMGNKTARDCLTVLPEDRKLSLSALEMNGKVVSVQYEIRSLDLSKLIENGTVKDITEDGEKTRIEIPIQNLIEKDREYLLRLSLDLGEKRVNYYTRILWTDKDFSPQMLEIAEDFTRKTFSKNDARALSVYLESDDTGDESTLAHVSLHSSFNQITWGDSGMQQDGQPEICLKELSGVMGEVQIRYASFCNDRDGNVRKFMNEDNFVFRYDPQRIFLMDYDRRTEEEFESADFRFRGGKLLVGIESSSRLYAKQSDSTQFLAFRSPDGLFRYDSRAKSCVRIFSYLSEEDKALRAGYKAHGIKILGVKNNGDVDFLVYGYFNRGRHEGSCGILYYTYDNSENTVVENFFLPLPEGYEVLEEDIQKLSYLSPNRMFYFYYDGNVYGVDTTSFELVTVAGNLENSEFAASQSGRYIAYQDSSGEEGPYESERISFVDLSDDKSLELTESGRKLRVLGFIGEDLIYGLTDPNVTGAFTPQHEVAVSELRIAGPDLKEKSRYQKDGIYYGNAEVSEDRVRFDEYRLDGGEFRLAGSDSIISSKQNLDPAAVSAENLQDPTLQKCWYYGISDIGGKTVKCYSPKSFSLEKSSSIDLNIPEAKGREPLFLAYSLGHFRGSSRTMQGAWEQVYEDYGYILDESGRMLWNRTDKANAVNLKNPKLSPEELIAQISSLENMERCDGFLLLNAYGVDLGSVLYYVGKGVPVLIREGEDYRCIFSYNAGTITLGDPSGKNRTVIARSEAEARFKAENNAFIAALKTGETLSP